MIPSSRTFVPSHLPSCPLLLPFFPGNNLFSPFPSLSSCYSVLLFLIISRFLKGHCILWPFLLYCLSVFWTLTSIPTRHFYLCWRGFTFSPKSLPLGSSCTFSFIILPYSSHPAFQDWIFNFWYPPPFSLIKAHSCLCHQTLPAFIRHSWNYWMKQWIGTTVSIMNAEWGSRVVNGFSFPPRLD